MNVLRRWSPGRIGPPRRRRVTAQERNCPRSRQETRVPLFRPCASFGKRGPTRRAMNREIIRARLQIRVRVNGKGHSESSSSPEPTASSRRRRFDCSFGGRLICDMGFNWCGRHRGHTRLNADSSRQALAAVRERRRSLFCGKLSEPGHHGKRITSGRAKPPVGFLCQQGTTITRKHLLSMQRQWLLLIVAALMASSGATAQAPPTPATPPAQTAPPAPARNATGCAPTQSMPQQGTIEPQGTTATDPRAEPLSDKLAKSDGVLCPPTGVDPEIRAPTPKTGNMPVIPPPGSPGGDPTIRPK
jgi:hypothetical protein